MHVKTLPTDSATLIKNPTGGWKCDTDTLGSHHTTWPALNFDFLGFGILRKLTVSTPSPIGGVQGAHAEGGAELLSMPKCRFDASVVRGHLTISHTHTRSPLLPITSRSS